MAAVLQPSPVPQSRYRSPVMGTQAGSSVAQTALAQERLPFRVRLVRSEEDLAKAVSIRHAAYARHLPGFAEQLRHPERSDFSADGIVLLAESRLDGSPLGTMRVQTR